jgi:hypothetical protein
LTLRLPSSSCLLAVADLLPHRLLAVQCLAALVDVAQFDRLSDFQFTAVRFFLADDHAKERRLARAVGADNADDGPRRHVEGHVLDQQPIAEALVDLLGADDDVAQARPRRHVDLQFFAGLLPRRFQ